MKFNFTYLFVLFGIMVSWSQTQVTGTQSFSYCYGNNEQTSLIYQSSSANDLIINFTAGTLESGYDTITLIDGNGAGNGTVLLDQFSGNISGRSFIARSGFITLYIESDGSISCQGNSQETLSYTITALNCNLPTYTFTAVPNCTSDDTEDSSLVVNVSSMNGHSSFTITAGTQTQTITSTGNYTFTGLPENTSINILFTISNTCTYNVVYLIPCIIESQNCTEAYELQVGSYRTQYLTYGDNTNGYNNEDDDFCGGDYGVWFTVTVPQGITSLNIAQIEHSGTLGDALTDGYLAIYRGSCTNLQLIECEDDTEDEDENYDLYPNFNLENLTPGEQLFIFASGYSSRQGIFEIAAWNSTLSTPEFSLNNQIKLYPNPASDVLTLATELEINNIEVYNLLGQNVLNNKGKKQINVSNLTTGTFIIKAQTPKGTFTSKFIKK